MRKTILRSLLALASTLLIYGCTQTEIKSYPNAPFKGVVEDGIEEAINYKSLYSKGAYKPSQ